MDPYESFTALLASYPSPRIACIVGAGLSAGSGLSTFRGENGMYKDIDPMLLASRWGFSNDPLTVWTWYRDRIAKVLSTTPNPGHLALVELERLGVLHKIITQNVDGLHLQAGQSAEKLVEIHGSLSRTHCFEECGREFTIESVPEEVPVMCECGSYQRPSVVFFGEAITFSFYTLVDEIERDVDILLLIGTSGTVVPVSQIPYAVRGSTKIININPDPKTFAGITDISFEGKAEEVLPRLVEIISASLES